MHISSPCNTCTYLEETAADIISHYIVLSSGNKLTFEGSLQQLIAHLDKIDGNNSPLSLGVFGQVPEDDIAWLQDSQVISTREGEVMLVLGWGK